MPSEDGLVDDTSAVFVSSSSILHSTLPPTHNPSSLSATPTTTTASGLSSLSSGISRSSIGHHWWSQFFGGTHGSSPGTLNARVPLENDDIDLLACNARQCDVDYSQTGITVTADQEDVRLLLLDDNYPN